MPTTTEQPTIASLEQLLEAVPDLHDMSAELAEREHRRDEVEEDLVRLVKRQHELRLRLAEPATEAERKKARDALATTVAEAAVLPDEATMANEAFALALHRWASACLGAVDELEAQARRDRNAGVAEADAGYREAVEKQASAEVKRVHGLAGLPYEHRLQKRQRELEKIRRGIGAACRPVFPYNPNGKRPHGNVDEDGKLRGHERWRDRQRAEIEERLRA